MIILVPGLLVRIFCECRASTENKHVVGGPTGTRTYGWSLGAPQYSAAVQQSYVHTATTQCSLVRVRSSCALLFLRWSDSVEPVASRLLPTAHLPPHARVEGGTVKKKKKTFTGGSWKPLQASVSGRSSNLNNRFRPPVKPVHL